MPLAHNTPCCRHADRDRTGDRRLWKQLQEDRLDASRHDGLGGLEQPLQPVEQQLGVDLDTGGADHHHNGKLGTVLAFGPKHLTVYLFEGDKGQSSSCTGACASVWPPVTGRPQAGAGAVSADLGTIKRSDGTTQVTYKGHPIYLYVKDEDDGDAYGEAIKSFGAEWYALSSSGRKVDLS